MPVYHRSLNLRDIMSSHHLKRADLLKYPSAAAVGYPFVKNAKGADFYDVWIVRRADGLGQRLLGSAFADQRLRKSWANPQQSGWNFYVDHFFAYSH